MTPLCLLFTSIGPRQHRRFGRSSLLLLILVIGVAGCQTPRRTPATSLVNRPEAPVRWVRTELYFGAVEAKEWQRFLSEVVTPRFPAGLTVLEANGQWLGRDQVVHPVPTRILILLHPGDPKSNESIEFIRRDYKAEFHHESVLRSDSPATVSF